ncbi:MAG: SGNH/GDSL hydrolase family protein [Acutalibacteraceae bacterium]
MKNNFKARASALLLSAAMLVSAAPLTFAADLKKENVTSDVTSEKLTVISAYPVSLKCSDIKTDAFTDDTANLLKKSGVKFEVLDNAKKAVAPDNAACTPQSIVDGKPDINKWSTKEPDGTFRYWFTSSKMTAGANPQGYVIFTLDNKYTIDDFYIMSSYRAQGALSSYEVYFSENEDSLFNAENLSISYNYTGYSNDVNSGKLNSGACEGQIYTYTGSGKPTGKYVGIKVLKGGLIKDTWLMLSEVGFHGTALSAPAADAVLDLSELNDEVSIAGVNGAKPVSGQEYKFTVATKNGAKVQKVSADGKELTADSGVYTVAKAANGMKITVETDRDDYATKDNVWNGVDLSRNKSLYGKTVWESDAVYNESFMLYKGRDKVKLLYPIDQIISVRSYDLQTVYWKGVDFNVVDGQIVPIQGGNMKAYGNAEGESLDKMKNLTSSGSTDWNGINDWSSLSYKYQYYVTYTHSKEWDNTEIYNKAPASQTNKLSKFYQKVKSGEQTNIVFYGDSITEGWNASGLDQMSYSYVNGKKASELSTRRCTMYGKFGLSAVPDWACESYAVQTVNALKKYYENDSITMINKAIGSTASSWGSKEENLEFLIGNTDPDLLIIAYGMNEKENTRLTQKGYIKPIIEYVRKINPDCSVLLVSAFYPNIWNSSEQGYSSYNLGAHEVAYYELAKEYDNVAVAPVYSMFESMLSAKEPCDYTSNLYNHPNDFGVRLYAEVVRSVLTGEGSTEEGENNNGGGGSGVTGGGSLKDNPLNINNDELTWKDNGLSAGDSDSLLDSLLKTGDPINLLLGLGFLLVSGGAVLGTVLYRRRKRKSE